MIKKGDRVKFINDTSVGVVSSINGAIANVTVEDGFEIPALLTDLVRVDKEEEAAAIKKMGVGDGTPVGPKGRRQPPKKEKPAAPKWTAPTYGKISLVDDYEDEDPIDLSYLKANYLKNRTKANEAASMQETAPMDTRSPVEETEYEIKLCFVPDYPKNPENSERLDCRLVNDSTYSVLYSISQWSSDDRYVTLLGAGKADADTKVPVRTYTRGELNKVGKLLVNLVLFKPAHYTPQPVESFTLELSPMKFVRRGSFVENEYFDEPAVVYTLATDDEQHRKMEEATRNLEKNLQRIGNEDKPKPAKSSKYADEPEIVDLHAEEILGQTDGMSHGEILEAQLARFTVSLDLALRGNRGGRIVFIHGVGNGRLKQEMQKLLRNKYPRTRYQDASFKEYGYGAMMVFL